MKSVVPLCPWRALLAGFVILTVASSPLVGPDVGNLRPLPNQRDLSSAATPVAAPPAAPTWTQYANPANLSVPGGDFPYLTWDQAEGADLFFYQWANYPVYYYYPTNNTWRGTVAHLSGMGSGAIGANEVIIGAVYNWQDENVDLVVQSHGTCAASSADICFLTYAHGSVHEIGTFSGDTSCNGIDSWDPTDHYAWWIDSASPSHTYTVVNNTVTRSAVQNTPTSQCNMNSAAVWDAADGYILFNTFTGNGFESYVGSTYTARAAPYPCEYLSLSFDASATVDAPVAYGCDNSGEGAQFVWTGGTWVSRGVPSATPPFAEAYSSSTFDPILGHALIVAGIAGGANGLWGVGPTQGNAFQVTVTATPSHAVTGANVLLNASVIGGNPPFTWSWRFADGGVSTERNPSHVYVSAGTYIARLWVNDSLSNSATTQVVVIVAAAPVPPMAHVSLMWLTSPIGLALLLLSTLALVTVALITLSRRKRRGRPSRPLSSPPVPVWEMPAPVTPLEPSPYGPQVAPSYPPPPPAYPPYSGGPPPPPY